MPSRMGETMEGLRAITVMQPWAWAILHAGKGYENRNWQTEYRGPLVIHAGVGKTWMRDGLAFLKQHRIEPPKQFEFGAVLGVVDVIDCVRPAETGPDRWAFGPWCLQLDDPRPLAVPVPMRGQLGLWRCDVEVVAELLDPKNLERLKTESREERIGRAIESAGADRVQRASDRRLF